MERPCPTCGRPASLDAANRARPFCSERCRLLDLGNWLDERYAIPAEPVDDAVADDADAERPPRRTAFRD